ncbi:hypothetical protein [Campylobacter sp.]|uniref:hypothetical protein n=1 Tax=Campylobacter sp. TaxID=205 RepID=UPI0025878C37|nr:hypothetical protein [Campylobacter sp.]MCI6641971.1 hypothetical protein [Campylobacter sp.]
MIRTKYNIELNIDDEVFHIEVREPNLKEKKELELSVKESKELLNSLSENENKRANLNRQIKENTEMIEINKELSKQSIKDKFSLFLENKTLIKKNKELNLELNKLKLPDFTEIDTKFENALNIKNEMLISGIDKEKLLNALKQKGIKNSYFWDILSKEIAKEQEKK